MYPLGVLPKLSEPDLSGRPFDHTLLPAHEEQDYGRAIRTIAAKLDCQLFSQKRQIIAVTSRKASEGKSTTAMTLAQSLAKSERTLLIDADLRMSTLGMRFGLPFRLRGLTDLLLFDGRASDFIKPTDTANLDILPAGRLTENPSELIRSQEFKALLKQLQHSYDRIVIDTPPMKAVKDSLYLGQLAGGVLLVMKASQSGEKALKGALETIANNNIDIDGIVINQLNIATAPAAEILHSLAPLIAV